MISTLDRQLFVINGIFFLMALLIGSKTDWIIGFLAMIILPGALLFGLYTLNKTHIMLMITVAASYLGIYGSLIPQGFLPVTPFQIFLAATFAVYFLSRLVERDLRVDMQLPLVGSLMLAVFLGFTSLYSPEQFEAIYYSISLAILVLFAFIFSDVFTRPSWFTPLFVLIIVTSLSLSLYTLYQFYLNPEMILYNALSEQMILFGRQGGTIGDPNKFAILLVFPVLYLSGKLLFFNTSLKEIALSFHLTIPLAIIFGAILTTYSRSAWLSLMVGLAAMFAISGNLKKMFYLGFGSLIALIALTFNSLFLQTIVNRIKSIGDVSLSVSNTSRIVLGEAGLEMFGDSFLWGNGYRAFRALAPHYIDATKTLGVIAPHNIVIELIADAGVVGITIFALVTFGVLRSGIRLYRNPELPDTFRPYLLTFLAHMISLLCFYQFYPNLLHDNIWWFSIGGVLAVANGFDRGQLKPTSGGT